MASEAVHFDSGTAGSMVILALGAFGVPLACRPVRLPAAVGEILFGVAVGPHVLNLVQVTEFTSLLAHLGFFLLMFIAGLELDFRRVEKAGPGTLLRNVGTVGAIFACGLAAALLLDLPLYVGVILSAISIGLPLALLHETGLARAPFGQDVLLLGSLGEFACILVATAIAAHADAGGLNPTFFGELAQLTVVFGLAYAILVVLRVAVWWKAEAFTRVVETHDPSEIGVRAGLALMFVFVAVTSALGIDPILGAFLAGALFSFVFRDKGALEIKFLSLGNGFFVPFFFIMVGLEFDLVLAMRSPPGLFLQLLLGLLLVHVLPMALIWGPRMAEGALGGLLLAAPLTLLVVLANLGRDLGFLPAQMHATILLLATVSSILYPFLFKLTRGRLLGA